MLTRTAAIRAIVLLTIFTTTVLRPSAACGTSADTPPATILETELPGYEVLNITEISGETWGIKLKASEKYPVGSKLYDWLNAALYINTMSGAHCVILNATLDLEFIYENMSQKLSVLTYNLTCDSSGTSQTVYEWFVAIVPVNEFAPEFLGAPFSINVPENTDLQTVLVTLRDNATDRDVVTSSNSDIHEFDMVLHSSPWTANQSHPFSMADRQDGVIQVAHMLDFESCPAEDQNYFVYNITVWDLHRWNSSSSLTIYVLDVDDQPPYFFYPGCDPLPCDVVYTCDVPKTFTGTVTTMNPANIMARDGDTLNYTVIYRIKTGPQLPDFRQYVSIDNETGLLSILKPLDVYASEIYFIIQAVEVSDKALDTDTTLVVRITDPQQGLTTQALNPAASTEEKSSRTMVIAISILAVVVLLAFVGLAVVVLYMKKRHDKPIYPLGDTKEDPAQTHRTANLTRVRVLAEGAEKGEDGVGEERGGSNTDSGLWSMTGIPSPGPHLCSSAPTHTRLMSPHPLPNGQARNGQPHSGQQHHSQSRGPSPASAQELSAKSRMSAEDILLEDPRTEEELQEVSMGLDDHSEPPAFSNGVYPNGQPALAYTHMNGHVDRASPSECVEEREGQGMGGVAAPDSPSYAPSRRLPPLSALPSSIADTKTTKRSRTSRKKRKEQMLAKQRSEVFDGTKTYPTCAEDTFYTQGPKQKIKLSSRKKKAVVDTRYWVVVDNDYTEI